MCCSTECRLKHPVSYPILKVLNEHSRTKILGIIIKENKVIMEESDVAYRALTERSYN